MISAAELGISSPLEKLQPDGRSEAGWLARPTPGAEGSPASFFRPDAGDQIQPDEIDSETKRQTNLN